MSSGDVIAQFCLEDVPIHKIDLARTARFGIIGCIFVVNIKLGELGRYENANTVCKVVKNYIILIAMMCHLSIEWQSLLHKYCFL